MITALLWAALVLLLWLAVAIPLALITGRSIHLADEHADREHAADLERLERAA